MEDTFKQWTLYAAMAIEGGAVIVIVLAALEAFIRCLAVFLSRMWGNRSFSGKTDAKGRFTQTHRSLLRFGPSFRLQGASRSALHAYGGGYAPRDSAENKSSLLSLNQPNSRSESLFESL